MVLLGWIKFTKYHSLLKPTIYYSMFYPIKQLFLHISYHIQSLYGGILDVIFLKGH